MNSEMQFDLAIPSSRWGDILQHPDSLLAFLDSMQEQQFQSFIVEALDDQDGAPEIGTLQVKEFMLQEGALSGSFKLYFSINRRFCCSDVEACANDYATVIFEPSAVRGFTKIKVSYFHWSIAN